MDYLKQKHPHDRDQYIDFEEESHTYTITHPNVIDPSAFTSVTTWIHTLFSSFDADKIIEKMKNSKNWSKSKYFGKTDDEIKTEWDNNRDTAAALGTKMHLHIEQFYNQILVNDDSIEYTYFQLFESQRLANPDEKDWIPFRTEWTIFDEDYLLAGSVDMIFEDPKTNTLKIFDWKRCKQIVTYNPWQKFAIVECINGIPDTNFWHYALQLNIYRTIIESKYQKKVDLLCLVCLHPENKNNSYIRIKVPLLPSDMSVLLMHRKAQIETSSPKKNKECI